MPSRRKFIQTNILGAAMVRAGRDAFAVDSLRTSETAPPKDIDERDYRSD